MHFGYPRKNPSLPQCFESPVSTRYSHLATLLLHFACNKSWLATATSLLALLTAAALIVGRHDIRKILSPPPAIEVLPQRCEVVPFRDAPAFRLVVGTYSPASFKLRLLSERLSLNPDVGDSWRCYVDVPLSKLSKVFGSDLTRWELQLIQPESFLGFALQDVVVLSLPYVGLLQPN